MRSTRIRYAVRLGVLALAGALFWLPTSTPPSAQTPTAEQAGEPPPSALVEEVQEGEPSPSVPANPEPSTDSEPRVEPVAEQAPAAEPAGIAERIDAVFGRVVAAMGTVLFYPLPTGTDAQVPFIVAWLFIGALFLTLRMGFINVRGFKHAIDVVRGRYDNPSDAGEVSHFQALASALSATVGLGNIAGVAIAVSKGGPGALFWMIVAALFGMTAKFVECTLGQKYRTVDENGTVMGGPMRYLKQGLAEKGMGKLGAVLAVVFAVFCIGGSFGGGNMFQANQAYSALNEAVSQRTGATVPEELFGLVMMGMVGIVILGGIKRIASTAEKIVPLMCGMYVLAAGFIVLTNLSELPHAIETILAGAFSAHAIEGGVIGVMVIGIQRAAFSNEAGIGSASIAHSAARTDQPVREGLVALLEPFIDTVIVCTATGIVIVTSGVLNVPELADADGAVLTMRAFEQTISWFPLVLTTAIILFAFSTMISWSYYGERCWTALFGPKSTLAYRAVFLVFVFVGSVANLGSVLDFSDLMILSMAVPNIFGLYVLSSDVRRDLSRYMSELASGTFKRYDV